MAYGVKEYRKRLEQLIREIDAVLTASADFTKVPEAQAALRAILQARKSAEKAPAKKVPASAVKKLDEISLRRPLQPPEGLGTENFHPGGLYSDTETWEQLATAVEKQVSSVNKRVAAFNTRIAETNDDLLTLMRAIKKLSEPPSMRLVRTIEHIERQVRELKRKTVDKSLDAIEGELDDLSRQTKLLTAKGSLEAGADLAYKGTGIRKSLGKKARKSIINQIKTRVEKEEKKPVSKRRRPPYLELDPMEVNVFMLFRSTPLPWMNGHIILDGDKLQIARTMVQKSGVWTEYFEPYANKTYQVVHLKHDILNDDGWVADSGALTAGQDCRPLAWGASS